MSTDNVSKAGEGGLVARVMALYEQHHHLLKYLFIGAMASAIDVVLFFILYNFVLQETVTVAGLTMSRELAAQSVSVPAAVIFSFVVNARHNFKTNDHALVRFISFSIVCIIGYLAGYWVILAVQQFFADATLGGNIGKIVSLPVVFTIQYVLNSKITFRPARPAAG